MERTKFDKARIIAEALIELTNCYCAVDSPLYCSQSEFENGNKELWKEAERLGLKAEVSEIISDYYNALMISFIFEISNGPQDSEVSETMTDYFNTKNGKQIREVANEPQDSESKEQS